MSNYKKYIVFMTENIQNSYLIYIMYDLEIMYLRASQFSRLLRSIFSFASELLIHVIMF